MSIKDFSLKEIYPALSLLLGADTHSQFLTRPSWMVTCGGVRQPVVYHGLLFSNPEAPRAAFSPFKAHGKAVITYTLCLGTESDIKARVINNVALDYLIVKYPSHKKVLYITTLETLTEQALSFVDYYNATNENNVEVILTSLDSFIEDAMLYRMSVAPRKYEALHALETSWRMLAKGLRSALPRCSAILTGLSSTTSTSINNSKSWYL